MAQRIHSPKTKLKHDYTTRSEHVFNIVTFDIVALMYGEHWIRLTFRSLDIKQEI